MLAVKHPQPQLARCYKYTGSWFSSKPKMDGWRAYKTHNDLINIK
jgi:hypothetical protein